LAEHDGKVVLVKRLYNPHMGDWALPAGFVEIDEGPVQAALRELIEATGLIGRIRGIISTFHIRSDPRGPIVTILYHLPIAGRMFQVADNTYESTTVDPEADRPLCIATPYTARLLVSCGK
jgi:8-oxo-dGTP diphosphatase